MTTLTTQPGVYTGQALDALDQQITDSIEQLTRLIAARRYLAVQANPGRTPFTESDEQQMASAAFSLAVQAMTGAVDRSQDKAATLLALRSWLDLAGVETRGGAA